MKQYCGAKTRKGTSCEAKALSNGKCRHHGGLSTGPRTKAGRLAIAAAQRRRWNRSSELTASID
ncbi:MAG: HGGxSTG domain-containing protein [Alphaproteobacteria bacterium]|nr:HGGxSTG domain-containing protein [Alphaproteobacteria bacterium]